MGRASGLGEQASVGAERVTQIVGESVSSFLTLRQQVVRHVLRATSQPLLAMVEQAKRTEYEVK